MERKAKKSGNVALRDLRKILGMGQPEFAALVGVTRDAVANWETGRNDISAEQAWRIYVATGVDEFALIRNERKLRVSEVLRSAWNFHQRPARFDWTYTKADYVQWITGTGKFANVGIPHLFQILSRNILTALYAAARAESKASIKGKCVTVYAAIGKSVELLTTQFRLDPHVEALRKDADWVTSGSELPRAVQKVFVKLLSERRTRASRSVIPGTMPPK